jgi:hypothetical protein
MSPTDTIAAVRRVNPVPAEPIAPEVGPLLDRLDLSVRALEDAFALPAARRRRSSMIPRASAGAAVAGAVAIAVIAIIGGSGTGGVSVAAAIDRAITPGPGVLHMVIDSENILGGHVTTSTHEEIWTAQNPRRQRILTTLTAGGETVEDEGALISTSPPRALSWSRDDANVIRENNSPVDQSDPTPVSWLHTAYAAGRLKVLGQESLNGRAVWRLSIQPDPSQPTQELGGAPIPPPTVLVDAHSFVPLENVVYSAGTQNGRTVLETTKVRYLTYQELPAGSGNESLLTLASHPGAKVVAEAAPAGAGEH